MSGKRGIDQLLNKKAKGLADGDSVSFTLVKGPNGTVMADPVDPSAPHEAFPLVARFSDSVVKPEFHKAPWNQAKLYQQFVPKAVADSDEEEEAVNQKRWKYRRNEVPRRQWILQEQEDFLETMLAKRQKRTLDKNKLSSRYEGLPEHNASRYAIFSQADQGNGDSAISIQLLPAKNCTINFAQPMARKTFSLSEAETVIQQQRHGVKNLHNHNEATSLQPVQRKSGSKSRLLDKLKSRAADDDEADDVMGDVTFRNRKGGGRARKELLNDLGDGVKVSDDGVLGGTNDSAFGGRQRFGNFKGAANSKSKVDKSERGADGAAMADDFYQRDVKAEYEELDYDANEQFDDDDVDLGEAEVVARGGGFVGEEDDSDGQSEEDDNQEEVTGAAGLATAAGFKLLLAKARGEITAPTSDDTEAGTADVKADESTDPKSQTEEQDHIAKIMAAAEKSRIAAEEKAKERKAAGAKPQVEAAIETDDNGQRIISLQAVRREIWLNHGQIQTKRLMKIFNVGRKSADERQSKFREVIKELCIMKNDPVSGRMLILKQHYSSM